MNSLCQTSQSRTVWSFKVLVVWEEGRKRWIPVVGPEIIQWPAGKTSELLHLQSDMRIKQWMNLQGWGTNLHDVQARLMAWLGSAHHVDEVCHEWAINTLAVDYWHDSIALSEEKSWSTFLRDLNFLGCLLESATHCAQIIMTACFVKAEREGQTRKAVAWWLETGLYLRQSMYHLLLPAIRRCFSHQLSKHETPKGVKLAAKWSSKGFFSIWALAYFVLLKHIGTNSQ